MQEEKKIRMMAINNPKGERVVINKVLNKVNPETGEDYVLDFIDLMGENMILFYVHKDDKEE